MGGASTLPQNLHLGFEVELAGYMSKMINNSEVCCDKCKESSGPAVVFCCTCREFRCQLCHNNHKRHRKLSKHKMVGLDQEGAKLLTTTMKPRDHYCLQPKHEYNKLSFYCETCKCFVCLYCTTVAHEGHGVTELSTIAKTHQIQIKETLEDAKVVATELTEAINGNDKIIEQVELCKGNAVLAINQAFETLQQNLEERKKTLLSEVETILLSKTTALTLQKEQFEKIVEDIGHYTEVASHILQTHTDYEMAALGGFIPTEVQATLKRVQTMSLTPNQHSHMFMSLQTDDLVSELSKFGQVTNLSPSSSTWTSTSVAKVGTRFHVKVESKTSEGEGYPHGDVQVKGEIRSKVHSGAVVYGEVEDHRDGTYTITLAPQTAGPHQLVITMDGQHVQNSPHDLHVRSKHDYNTLSTLQGVIKCSGTSLCVAIHDNEDIYVGSYANCIYVFDKTGQLKNTIGSDGSGDGQFSQPFGISIKGDVLYVADYDNHRVQKLTTSGGKFLHKFGHYGSCQGEFKNPSAVIVDSNNIVIVSDDSNHRIQIFNDDGGWLLTIDGKSSGNYSFHNPWGLALDPQGNIHVAAFGSNAIKVFTKEGVYVRTYGDSKGPMGIAIDGDGYSFVSANDGSGLTIFDPQGKKIHTVLNGSFPRGIALDPRGCSVYVADFSCAVSKYSI